MAHKVQEFENIKHVIRALLLVNNGPMRLDKFVKQYHLAEGHSVPYQRFGYSDCLSFLRNLDDTVTIHSEDDAVTYLSPIITEGNVEHIRKLIQAQRETRVSSTKRTSPRITRYVTPCLPENLHRNLCVLVSKFREGVDIAFIEDSYFREFGRAMNIEEYGFKSLADCLATVDCLELVEQPNGKTRARLKSSSTGSSMRSLSRARNAVTSAASRSSSKLALESFSEMKENVKKMLEKYPNGVFLSSFSQLYKEVSGQELEITTMEIIQRWPELFHLERPHSGSDFMVFSSDCVFDVTEMTPRSDSSTSGSSTSSKHNVSFRSYEYKPLPEVDSNSYFPVKVTHVFSPGRLSIQTVDPTVGDPLSNLMKQINKLYAGPDSSRYALQSGTVMIGQAVAVLYSPVDNNAVWYRASITGVCNLFNVEVHLVDFGNRCIVRKSELRELREDFLNLPAQAVAVSLAFIRPKGGGDDWPESAYKELVQLSSGKILMCQIIDPSTSPPAAVLCDTTRGEDVEVFLSDALVEAGHAEYISPADSAEGSVENCCMLNGNGVVDYDSIRLVSLSTGEKFHVVPYEGLHYITSFDLSCLLGWSRDTIEQKLAEKEIIFPHIILREQDTPEMFKKVNSLNVEERPDALHAQCVCLFPIKNIADAVNIFRHAHNEINREIQHVVDSYTRRVPVGEVVCIERLCLLCELYRMRELKRQLYAGFSREISNVKRVDEIHHLEQQIVSLARKLEEL